MKQKMKVKLNLMLIIIVLLFATQSYGVQTFQDLKKTTSTNTVQVKFFDNNTKQGGGIFLWVPRSTVGVEEITGYRAFVTGKTSGYWERLESPLNFNPAWCGARNDGNYATLTSLGITQGTANIYWGYDYDGITPLVDVTTMSYDEAAIQYMFRIMEKEGFYKVNFESKKYYLRRGKLKLPRTYEVSSNLKSKYIIKGNAGQIFFTTTSGSRSAFYSYPVNQADCDGTNQIHPGRRNLQERTFYIDNLSFIGAGGTSNDTAIFIGTSYMDKITNCFFTNLAVGVRGEFTLSSVVDNCEFVNLSYANVIYQRGTWSGVGGTNANCHKSKVINCRSYNGSGMWAAFMFKGMSGGKANDNIIEGNRSKYGIYFDDEAIAEGVTTVRTFEVNNLHYETGVDSAGIYLRLATGVVNLTMLHPDNAFWASGGSAIFIQANGTCCQSEINVSLSANMTCPNLLFANRGGNQTWNFYKVKGLDNTAGSAENATCWVNNGYYSTPNFTTRVDQTLPVLP